MIARKSGQPWTDAEDGLCHVHHPDYKALMNALKGRTYSACRARCQKLGLADKRYRWTALRRIKLRKIYPTASTEELQTAFPGLTYWQIANAATYYKIHKEKKPFKRTGFPEIDQIRDYCFINNMTMVELDRISGTKSYFSSAKWLTDRQINYRALGKAIKALGAEIVIEWMELD